MRLKWKYFFKMSPHHNCEIFWPKMGKILKLDKIENLMKTQSILKKKTKKLVHLSKKDFLPKLEGPKYAGGSRSSCFLFLL